MRELLPHEYLDTSPDHVHRHEAAVDEHLARHVRRHNVVDLRTRAAVAMSSTPRGYHADHGRVHAGDSRPMQWFEDAATPSCSGPCHQGRRRCLTPDACRLPEGRAFTPAERRTHLARGAVVALVVVLSVIAAAAVVHWVARAQEAAAPRLSPT